MVHDVLIESKEITITRVTDLLTIVRSLFLVDKRTWVVLAQS